MSFSSDIKTELCQDIPKSIHCRIAELAGIISVNGRVEEYENDKRLIIRAENETLEDLVRTLLSILFKASQDKVLLVSEKMHHRKLVISHKDLMDEIYLKLKLNDDGSRIRVDKMVTERSCCKKLYLRGAFIAGGYMGSPEKNYQLELSLLSQQEAERISDILLKEGLESRISKRRDRFVLYVKDGDTISALLGLLGAGNAMMEFENIRILKDIRNVVNREVNCDTANMAKTASAAAKHIEDIKYIRDNIGLDYLSDVLRETASLRLEYPMHSIKELGELFNPPVGKSGINHRLRKISSIADELRNK